MEDATRLVSTGELVKVWDSSSMMPLEQFSPHCRTHSVAQACWSSNNQYMLTSSSSGDKLVLSSLKSSPVAVVELADGRNQTRVCLSSSSQFVASGGLDHCVHIWDLKTKRLLRSFKEHTDEVTCVTFSPGDSCVASSSISGDVLLHSMTTHQSGKLLGSSSAAQAVQEVRFSAVKRSLLGSCSVGGAVVLFDSNTQKELHTFDSAHKAPACALAFSPTSDLLLVSVGLDKRVVCYDTASKIVLRSIRADSPLTAVDFTPDGTGLVVGTTRGSIYQYDLRNSSSPTKVTLAHKTSVTCLRFQNTTRHKSSKLPPTKISSIKRSSSKPPSNQSEDAPSPSPGPAPSRQPTSTGGVGAEPPSREAEGRPGTEPLVALEKFGQVGRSSLDIFSPVRDGPADVYRHLSLTRDSSPSVLIGPDPKTPSADSPFITIAEAGPREGPALTGRGSLDIFSPTRDDSHRRTPLTAGRSFSNVSVFPSPLTIKEEEPVGTQEAEHDGKSDKTSSPSLDDSETPPPSARQTNHRRLTPESSPCRANGDPSSSACDSAPQEAPPTAAAAGQAVAGAPMTPLQVHFIQNMIHDTLEEFWDKSHKDVINLQVEMIRQFYIQLKEIHSLLEKYSVNESLVEEIERLREEIRQLKANY